MEPLPSRVIPKRPGRSKPKPKRTWIKGLVVLLALGLIFDIVLLALQIGLPAAHDVLEQKGPEASWVMTADGRVLGELYEERRRTISANDMPPLIRNAFVAAHDPTFLTRGSLSVSDMIAAYFRSGSRADGHPGGISVPLAYTVMPKAKSTYGRLRAWLFARRLENSLSKDDLLTLYLNRVDLGEGGHGIEEAALHFFSRRASELGPTQAALLASIAPRPTSRSPRGPENLVIERRNLVLDRMVKIDAISSIDVQKEKERAVGLQIFHADPGAYLQSVRNRLRAKLGREKLATGGLTIEVSQDNSAQSHLLTALRDASMAADERSGWRGPISSVSASTYDAVRDRVLGKVRGVIDIAPALPLLAGGNVDAISAVVKILAPESGQVAIGRVSEVRAGEMRVEMGGVTARIPASEANWATAALPPLASGLDQLVHPGDLVWVRLLGGPNNDDNLVPGHLSQRGAFDAAGIVAEVDTGRILAMVGGVLPDSGRFNRAVNLVRPVGAGLSMVTYAEGIDTTEMTAASMLERAPGISPSLWDGDTAGEDDARERRKLTAYEAFVTHDVGANAAIVAQVGPNQALAIAQQLGFRRTNAAWLLKGPLGSPWALANAWTVFGNAGTSEPPHTIDDVLDHDAKRVWASVDNTSPILKQSTVNLMRHWLANSNPDREEILASHLGLDSWCGGLVGKAVAAVWVGPNRIIPGLKPVPGDGPARQAFEDAMTLQHAVELGESVVMANIDLDTGLISKDPDGRAMPFLSGTPPEAVAPHHAPRKHVTKSAPKRKSGHH